MKIVDNIICPQTNTKKKNQSSSDEENDVTKTLNKLTLSPSSKFGSKKPTVKDDEDINFDKKSNILNFKSKSFLQYRDKKNNIKAAEYSDTESEDEAIPKGPGRPTKKIKEQRYKNAPYSATINLEGLVNDADMEDLVQNFLNGISTEEKNCLFPVVDSLSPDPISHASSLPDITMSTDIESHTTDNITFDKESGYDSCSPRSIAYSPSNYSYSPSSYSEASPIHENDASTYAFPTPNLPVPGRSIKKSGAWNIPTKPIESRSLPTTPTLQRRIIRPEPLTVYNESEMTKPAADRIKANIKQNKRNFLDIEWTRVLIDKEFTKISPETNETKLMNHIRIRPRERFFEVLHSILERIRQEKLSELLKFTNQRGESALSLAAKECYDLPVVARYVVDVMVDLGENPDQVDQYGNSKLIQELILGGDMYVQVLAELVNAKIPSTGQKVFNINRKNIRHETALHRAVMTHSDKVSTYAITKLLVKHGANVSLQDIDGMTPVHLLVQKSCNPMLMRALLSSNFASNARHALDAVCETALHYAAKRTNISPELQADIMKQLVDSGWNLRCENINKMTPLNLLPESRKGIKDMLLKK